MISEEGTEDVGQASMVKRTDSWFYSSESGGANSVIDTKGRWKG